MGINYTLNQQYLKQQQFWTQGDWLQFMKRAQNQQLLLCLQLQIMTESLFLILWIINWMAKNIQQSIQHTVLFGRRKEKSLLQICLIIQLKSSAFAARFIILSSDDSYSQDGMAGNQLVICVKLQNSKRQRYELHALQQIIMYRNTYLQMYKTASSTDSSITFMFAHFTQIYNTLGCVLQDLEYQMGKLLIQQPSTTNERIKESYEQFIPPKQKIKEKEIIKIEEPQVEGLAEKSRKAKGIQIQSNQSKPITREQNKEKKYANHQQTSARIKQKNRQTKQSNPRENTEERVQIYPVEIARKGNINPLASDSFESFFEPKKPYPQQVSQIQPQNSNFPRKQHAYNHIQNPVIENTYDDFLDRFFKEDRNNKQS